MSGVHVLDGRPRRRLCRHCKGDRTELVPSIVPGGREVQWCGACDGRGWIDEPSKRWIEPWTPERRNPPGSFYWSRDEMLTVRYDDGRILHGTGYNSLRLNGSALPGGSGWALRPTPEQARWLDVSAAPVEGDPK